MENKKAFGQRLKERRRSKGLIQKELAKLVGVSSQVISNWERGYTTGIDADTLNHLSRILDCSVDYLVTGNSEESTKSVDEALKDDAELKEFWSQLKEREDLQLMFKKSKNLPPQAIRQIIGIIKLIEDKEDDEYNGE